MQAGGVGIYYSTNPSVNNNTICNNRCATASPYTVGGGLYVNSDFWTNVTGGNNIIYNNAATLSPNLYGTPNLTYSCVQGGYSGLGNLSANPLFVTGASGNEYCLSQMEAGQTQTSPCVNAGDPSFSMIIGTTRTDGMQDAGVVDMGYHAACFSPSFSYPPVNFSLLTPPDSSQTTDPRPVFDWEDTFDPDTGLITYKLWYDTTSSFSTPVIMANLVASTWQSGSDLPPETYWWKVYAFDDEGDSTVSTEVWRFTIIAPPPPPPVTIALTPENPPLLLPPGGGSFMFEATLTNTTTIPQLFEVWTEVCLPDGSPYGPVLGPFALTLPANFSLTRMRTQEVPGAAPAGNYRYRGFVGTYPLVLVDSDSFPFVKSTGLTEFAVEVTDWFCTGSPFPGEEVTTKNENYYSSRKGLTTFIISTSPNPFNPSTAISFKLPAASNVSLHVYDTAGRLVATLVDGWREVGEQEVTFDESGLPSGIYLYRLTAGPWSETGKMILLK